MSKQKIVVVTDSAAYIPQQALNGLHVPVIPLWLLWDDDRFRDGVDIQPAEFYSRLRKSKTFPSSSQPSRGEFIEFFRQVSQEADAIVGVMVSSGISGTFENAQAAAEQLPELTIRLVDTRSITMGQGFAVLAAARAAAAGRPLDEVVAAAEKVRDNLHLILAVDTLEFLHRGGRIGGAKRLLGTALKLKPLLHFVDGKIEPLAQVRTKSKAVAHMLDVVEERLNGKRMVEVAVADVDSPAEGDDIAQQVKERFGVSTVYRSTVSPVVGSHAGPGTVCITFYT
jgi:DegV family protein with EDD domain